MEILVLLILKYCLFSKLLIAKLSKKKKKAFRTVFKKIRK